MRTADGPDHGPHPAPSVLAMSSSLLDDRKLTSSSFLEGLSGAALTVLATSAEGHSRAAWEEVGVEAHPLPERVDWSFLPYGALRRINDAAWDEALGLPAREHRRHHQVAKPWARALDGLGHGLGRLGRPERFDRFVGRRMVAAAAWDSLEEVVDQLEPDVALTTGPNRGDERSCSAALLRAEVPVAAYLHSIDNLTTKPRMLLPYGGYLVWSDAMAGELRRLYPAAREVPVEVVGAAQFDAFAMPEFAEPRDVFLERLEIPSDRQVVLVCLGSPNFIEELPVAQRLVEEVGRGALGNVHLIVRPHPQFGDGGARSTIASGERVTVQHVPEGATYRNRVMDRSEITEWVSSFRHADLVVNLASTATIDAAIADTPVISLGYDPSGSQNKLVREIHRSWPHFAPLVGTGAVRVVADHAELLEGIEIELATPERARSERAELVELTCGTVDGRSGRRLAEALLEIAGAVRT